MIVRRTLAVAILLALTVLGARAGALAGSGQGNTKVIIIFRPSRSNGAHAASAQALVEQFGARGLLSLEPLGIDGPVPGTPAYLGVVAPHVEAGHLASELAGSPLVLRAEPDVSRRFLDIDPDTGPLDAEFIYQSYYFDIGIVAMWARELTGIIATHPITVAVIDTGVDLDHPDIDDNLAAGFDFVQMDGAPQDESPDSHGSMVAGVIGAEINNDVVAGVARGVAGIGGGDALSGTLGLRLMTLRVAVDASSGLDCAASAQAIDYATAHGARVINMSYGGNTACPLELDAVRRAYDAGVALVAGAGNDNTAAPFYPAAYGAGTNDHLVIAVAGLYPSGEKADASNYGTWVDVSAPFRQIRSIANDGGYDSASGTSFSAPFVSGLVGVLMSNYGWSRDKALSVILASADNMDALNPTYQGLLGAGRINADRASAMVRNVYLPLSMRDS